MLDPKMVSRDCLHLLAVAFDGLRAVTSRRVEGTATSLIATTDCLRLLVIAFDRSCAIVCAIARDHFGIQHLKDAQWEVIESVVYHRKNTIFHAPTGSGKSLTMQIPPLIK